jgi:hypothetical protein
MVSEVEPNSITKVAVLTPVLKRKILCGTTSANSIMSIKFKIGKDLGRHVMMMPM